MCHNRLTWPDRAGLLPIVTEGDDEIELRIFELFPRLTVGLRRIDSEIFAENLDPSGYGAGFGLAPAL